MIRIAINGFGRIGRQILQAGLHNPNIEWVAVNDLTDAKTLAYLLKYDSVYGSRHSNITYDDKSITIEGKNIKLFAERDPKNLPWKELNIDIAIESTGIFRKREQAKWHLDAGAKKVIISAPGKEVDLTIVKGVNESTYDKNKHHIISNASCTTNCLAPMIKVLHDNFTVIEGFMVTAHGYTADQALVDTFHKSDPRRGRAAAQNIIPTSTGAAVAVTEVIPSLKGKLDGFAWRVPVICGSIVQFTGTVEKETSEEHVKWLFKEVAKNHLQGILEVSEEPIVSRDILGNPHSCILDAELIKIIGKTITISGWYDNEWGYSNRMVDIAQLLL